MPKCRGLFLCSVGGHLRCGICLGVYQAHHRASDDAKGQTRSTMMMCFCEAARHCHHLSHVYSIILRFLLKTCPYRQARNITQSLHRSLHLQLLLRRCSGTWNQQKKTKGQGAETLMNQHLTNPLISSTCLLSSMNSKQQMRIVEEIRAWQEYETSICLIIYHTNVYQGLPPVYMDS
jgi:hypothetical protein